jgi:hypothetical protein
MYNYDFDDNDYSDEMDMEDYDYNEPFGDNYQPSAMMAQPGMYGAQPGMYGGQPGYGGSNYPQNQIGGGNIMFGAASKFGDVGSKDDMMYQNVNLGGADAITSDYVDLTKIKEPKVDIHKPNKYATSSKSSLKKKGKKKDDSKGVSFGETKTYFVDKESSYTETDK